MEKFTLGKDQLYKPKTGVGKGGNGQVVIIGGSELFHGAPILSLKVASRIVDMVFFTSPEPSVGRVAEQLKSKLFSFIWVPWEEVDRYIEKSDAILIGPGLMRYRKEGGKEFDGVGEETKRITEELIRKFPKKQWVIDAGSLQVMDAGLVPKNAILTPNKKEFKMLFGNLKPQEAAKKHRCVIVTKNKEIVICSPEERQTVEGKDISLTKGGVGDVLAGLAVALATKNPPFLAACVSSWIMMQVVDELYKKVGSNFNADDLAEELPRLLERCLR